MWNPFSIGHLLTCISPVFTSSSLYKTESHAPSHHLEPVHHHETFLDMDYSLAQTPGYNYLDPSYYPANR